MNHIAIYTLTSALHDEQAVSAATSQFLTSLHITHDLRGADFSDFGAYPLSLIYVRTGGTEAIFKSLMPQLLRKSSATIYLLTSGESNSLAASLEILTYLRQHGVSGEILHGRPSYVRERITLLEQAALSRRQLSGQRLGIIGQPSDWLIASQPDPKAMLRHLGVELIEIPMDELLQAIEATPLTAVEPSSASVSEAVSQAMPGANRIYSALKTIIGRYRLRGFTLRCFDLLTAVHNTGCMALARLNAEGIVAGCEGDVPTMLSMAIAQTLPTGVTGFQANPSAIDPETGELVFAHCTIPLNMVERYELDTHFESGIGVGIRGFMAPGPVTIFKTSADLSRSFVAEGTLTACGSQPNLCRTQMHIRLDDKSQTRYFLTTPIGNHHVIIPGRYGRHLHEIMSTSQHQ